MARFEEGFQEAAAAFALRRKIDRLRSAPGIRKAVRKEAHAASERLRLVVLGYTGSSRVAKAAVARGSWTCWYTGEALDPLRIGTSDPMAPTAEHLQAEANGGTADEDNLFVSAKWINCLVANAPVAVKKHVRHSLSKLAFLPSMDAQARLAVQHRAASEILDSYKLDGVQARPWLAAADRQMPEPARKRAENRVALIERFGEAVWA